MKQIAKDFGIHPMMLQKWMSRADIDEGSKTGQTWTEAAGFPPYQVSRWLGHASVVTTDTIYSHLYPTDYAQHIARFERFANEA